MNWFLSIYICIHMGILSPDASKRKLFVFGDEQSAMVTQQVKLFNEAASELHERDMVVKVVGTNSALIKKFNAGAEPFLVVLVGKDGGEKHRTNKLLSTEELFAIVDAMPMRKAEMKRRN